MPRRVSAEGPPASGVRLRVVAKPWRAEVRVRHALKNWLKKQRLRKAKVFA